jgi:hypothetical protein
MRHHVEEYQNKLNNEEEAEKVQDTRFEAARFHTSIIARGEKYFT